MDYKGKRVVISGGAGFIGTHIADYLSKRGAIVTAFDLKVRPDNLSRKVHYLRIDARNKSKVLECLKDCDVFYNLACDFGGARYIHENQAKILSYNLQIFASTFEAASEAHVGRIVFPSSSLAYNESLTGRVTEGDMEKYPPTKNPYGFMKLVGEYFCRYFWNQYKLSFTIVRMFNVYGPGDSHMHAVPNFIKEIISGKYPIEIMGDGTETRVFTYIDDIVEALSLSGFSEGTVNETFNLSSEEKITMHDLCRRLWGISGNKKPYKEKLIPIPSTTPTRRNVSSQKVYDLLGWQPKTELDIGLAKTFRWIKNSSK